VGLPGLRHLDHIGFTVPDLDEDAEPTTWAPA
jgi:hypothetical protein